MNAEKIRSRPPYLTIILIFFCFIYFTYAWPGFWNTNEYSRIFLTRSLVDHQSFAIDKVIITHNTQDKSYFDGHYYTNKAPASSLIAVPAYLLIRLGEIYSGLTLSEEMVLYLIKTVCLSLPSALFLLLLFKFWNYISMNYHFRRAGLIVFSLGTMIWPYSSMYYSHQLAGMSLFLAFLILFAGKGTKAYRRVIFEAGFFCGLAFALEYPSALLAVLLFVYGTMVFEKPAQILYSPVLIAVGIAAFLLRPAAAAGLGVIPAWIAFWAVEAAVVFFLLWKAPILIAFILGALLPVAVTFYYHSKCFGGILQLPYFFETYGPFAAAHREGIAGVVFPADIAQLRNFFSSFLQLLISPYRGLFFYSPVLLLGISGIIKMIRDEEWRKEGWFIFSAVLVYFLFLSAFSDWEGGWSMGPRHLVPLLPFLMTALIFQLGRMGRKATSRLVTILAPLALVSIVFTFAGTASFPYFPKEMKNPLFEIAAFFLGRGVSAPSLGTLAGLKEIISLVPPAAAAGFLSGLLLWDLSWPFREKPAARFLFIIFGVGSAAGIILLGAVLSRQRDAGLDKWDQAPMERQRTKIAGFMGEKNLNPND